MKMKKLVTSVFASSFLLMAGGDIAPVIPASTDNWSGIYFGVQTGGIWGNGDVTYTNNTGESFKASGLNPDGLTGGLYGGYNWLLADNWLLGVEGEWNSVVAHDLAPISQQSIMRSKVDQNQDISLRLRAGKVMGSYLPYITGGAAWSRFDIQTCFLENCQNESLTMAGWTAGVGVEMALTSRLHARIQYRYTDYNDKTAPVNNMPIPIENSRIDYNNQMMSIGFSYRLDGKDITPATSVSADGWNGLYLGIQTGRVWGNGDVTYSNGTGGTFITDGLKPDGLISGLYGGYNWSFADNWLWGIEGEWNDIAAYDSGLVTHAPLIRTKIDQDWDSSVHLRAGKVIGNYFPYLTGGVAWSQFKLQDCYIQTCQSKNVTLTGWTAGVGVEMKLTSRLHARLQYRYTNYGDKTTQLENSPSFKLDARLDYDSSMLSAGISYQF